jgi:predicted HTH domain antitoxin
MTIQLDIPDSVVQAMRLPGGERKERLTLELALSLYAQGILSFGKARQLAKLSHYEFSQLLGQRGIPRHYEDVDLQDDLNYAHRK